MTVKKINPAMFDLIVTRDILQHQVRENAKRVRGYEYYDPESEGWWVLPHHHTSLKIQNLLKGFRDADFMTYVEFYGPYTKVTLVGMGSNLNSYEVDVETDDFANPLVVATGLAIIGMKELGIDQVVLAEESVVK